MKIAASTSRSASSDGPVLGSWIAAWCLVWVTFGALAAADEIRWTTVDTGPRETAIAGATTLRATVGQVEATAVATGGSFTLRGGFWPGAVALHATLFVDGFESGDFGAWSLTIPPAPDLDPDELSKR
ncbi:MAG: hypothetical protein AB7G12_13740 [Thermoanaerobaculia bacterium]